MPNRKETALYCIDVESGEIYWEHDIKTLGSHVDILGYQNDGKAGPLCIADDRVYCHTRMNLACIDLNTGALIWKSEQAAPGGMSAPLYKDGKVYTIIGDGRDRMQVMCLDAANGKKRYTGDYAMKKSSISAGSTEPFISGNTLFAAYSGLFAFNTDNGELVWEYHSEDDNAPFEQPVFVNGRLYAGCADGYLFCFENSKN